MRHKATPPVTRCCEHCGIEFSVLVADVRRGGGRFHNRACYIAASTTPLAERFWRRVKIGEGCWTWIGSLSHGYGQMADRPRRPKKASRISWELHFGAIPIGMFVCHRCDNPPCVRPDHLFLASNAGNVADKMTKNRQPRGEHTGHAKLTDEQVVAIRQRWTSGQMKQQKDLATEFGVSRGSISMILSGKTRTHASSA